MGEILSWITPQRPYTRRVPKAAALKLAVWSLVAYLAIWILLVNTRIGQQLDDRALIARGILPKDVVRSIDNFLAFSTPFFAASFCVILLVLGWRTHRKRLGIAMTVSFGVTEVVGETLKYLEERRVLDPSLYDELGNKTFNSFPSGTTALAAGFALGLIALSTERFLRLSFLLGLLFIQLVAMFVVLAGWHRPSDALGGVALAVFFACIGLWLGNFTNATHAVQAPWITINPPWKSAAALGAGAILTVFVLGRIERLPQGIYLLSLSIFMMLIPLFAALMVAKFARLAGLGLPSTKPNA